MKRLSVVSMFFTALFGLVLGAASPAAAQMSFLLGATVGASLSGGSSPAAPSGVMGGIPPRCLYAFEKEGPEAYKACRTLSLSKEILATGIIGNGAELCLSDADRWKDHTSPTIHDNSARVPSGTCSFEKAMGWEVRMLADELAARKAQAAAK